MDKPFQIILMAVFGLAALVGVFVFANYSGSSTSTTQVGVVRVWGVLPQETMDAAIASVQSGEEGSEKYGQISYEAKSAGTFSQELSNAIAAGTGPDLILISQEELLTETPKLSIIPYSTLPKRTYVGSYVQMSELFASGEGVYGVPFAVDPLVLYYNKDYLSEAGIALPATSWEAILGQTAMLTRIRDDQSIERSAIALGEFFNVRNASAILSLLLLQSGTSITARDEQTDILRSTLVQDAANPNFGIAPAVSAVNYYGQFANPAKTVYSWNRALPDSRTFFLQGDLAYYLGFASERATLATANPNLSFDMASAPTPMNRGKVLTYGRLYAFAIPKASQNPTGALTAAYALSALTDFKEFTKKSSLAPARLDLLQNPSGEDLYAPVVYTEALKSSGWLSPGAGTTDALLGAMMSTISSGRKDTVDAVNTLDQELNNLLR